MIELIGAGAFGLVVGWIVYRTLRRREDKAAISDLSAVVAAIGGGAVTQLFPDERLFGAYGIGLAVGFLSYLIVNLLHSGAEKTGEWMGGRR